MNTTLYFASIVFVGLIAALTRNRRIMGYAGVAMLFAILLSLFIGG